MKASEVSAGQTVVLDGGDRIVVERVMLPARAYHMPSGYLAVWLVRSEGGTFTWYQQTDYDAEVAVA